MSYPLTISGFITQILSIEIKEDSDYSHNFYLQRIHISARGQEYVVDFLKEKIKLLEKCVVGDEVEIDLTLIARSWVDRFNERRIYNVLKAQKLKILSSEFNETILYQGDEWDLFITTNELGYENLILINRDNSKKFLITNIINDFESLDTYFHVDVENKNLLEILKNLKVVEIGNKITFLGKAGYGCKLNEVIRLRVL